MNESAPSANCLDRPPRPGLCLVVGSVGQDIPKVPINAAAVGRAAELLKDIRFGVDEIDALPWYRPGHLDLRVLSSLSSDTERHFADLVAATDISLDVVKSVGAVVARTPAAARRLDLACAAGTGAIDATLPREAVVAHSSLIIAIWDGSRRCSAADAVFRAVAAGVPVILVPIDPAQPTRLLWSEGTDALLTPENIDLAVARLCTPAALAGLLAAILLPPDDQNERAQLRQFLDESFYTRNLRIGYPLLLAVTGTQRLRCKSWNKALYPPEITSEWERFKASGSDHAGANHVMLSTLEESFLWANQLGSHFAQTMRSALVINFSFSAVAVLAALAGLATTTFKLPLALAEIFIIAVIILNIRRGTRQAWQRRWLDYRNIAERLRPFRSLKLLGIASQPRRIQRKGTNPPRWIDWYVAAIWREMGLPQGVIDTAQLDRLCHLVAEAELSGEIAYHRTNASRMRHLEERLHLVGDTAFVATLLVCTVFPLLYLSVYDVAMAWSTGFVILSAGLPAIGGAIYALRVHGDYGGAAGRSLETAAALDRIRTAILAPDVGLAQVANLTTAAARVMLVDLDEWQMTYAQRSLAIPS
jgi:hypothetical protein